MVGKTFSSLIFWKHGAVYKFYGAIDISFQIRRGGGGGNGFPIIRGLEKPKSLYTGT